MAPMMGSSGSDAVEAGRGGGGEDGQSAAEAELARATSVAEATTSSSESSGTPSKVVVHAALLSVQLAFSGWHVFGAAALDTGVNPLVVALYREVSASLMMLAVALTIDGWVPMQRRHYFRFVCMGFYSFVNVVGTLIALTLLPPTNYALLQPSIPVFGTFLSIIVGYEKVSGLKVIGILFAVAGAVMLEFFGSGGGGDDDHSSSDLFVGNLIVVCQCICMASLLVATKSVSKFYPSATVTTYYYAIGAVMTIVVCFGSDVPWHKYAIGNGIVWGAIAYAAVCATLYTYNIYSWTLSLKRVSPSIVSVYSTAQPVSTAILSFCIFGDIITWKQVLGGFVVAIGLVCTVRAHYLEEHRETVGTDRHSPSRLGGDEEASMKDSASLLSEGSHTDSSSNMPCASGHGLAHRNGQSVNDRDDRNGDEEDNNNNNNNNNNNGNSGPARAEVRARGRNAGKSRKTRRHNSDDTSEVLRNPLITGGEYSEVAGGEAAANSDEGRYANPDTPGPFYGDASGASASSGAESRRPGGAHRDDTW